MDVVDTGAWSNWGSRDVNCALDVDRMAKMGKFPVDFHVYGCAYEENGEILYRISSDEEKMYEFIQSSVYEGRYPTAMDTLTHTQTVLSDQYEEIMEQVKYTLARTLRQQYQALFPLLRPFAALPPNNAACAMLESMVESLEGCFDERALQLLEGAIDLAFSAKVLTWDSERALMHWLEKQRVQMQDDPVAQDKFGRTFYGFGYEAANGTLSYYCDAQKVNVYEKHQALNMQGLVVLPIFHEDYWFSSRSQLSGIKKAFRQELAQYHNEAYLTFVKELRALPGVVSKEKLDTAIDTLQMNGEDAAATMLRYYRNQWNLC